MCDTHSHTEQMFTGQVMGTAVGSKVFLEHGWRASCALSLGWTVWQVLILLARGPHVGRYTWFGYEGGIEWRKDVVAARLKRKAEDEAASKAAQAAAVEAEEKTIVKSECTGASATQVDEKDPSRMV